MRLATFQIKNAFILYDAGILCDAAGSPQISPEWFTAAFWQNYDAVVGQAPGRGTSFFVNASQAAGIEQEWVLRGYRRGGIAARISDSHYLWAGLERSRAYRELRLTAALHEQGLPTPAPVAGCVWYHGLTYQASLLTVRLAGAQALAELLPEASDTLLAHVGATIRRFHDAGLDHVDLNARNLLVTPDERVWLIDLDRCRLRRPGHWKKANLQRLQRSLERFAPGEAACKMRFLLRGYHSA